MEVNMFGKMRFNRLETIAALLYLKNLKRSKIRKTCSGERHGSDYGGWVVCPESLSKTSIIYSLGIGEDTSWDEELIAKYGVKVFGFDPTPKSATYVQRKNLQNFTFFQIGVADHEGLFKFYPPKNSDYVSCSIFKQQDLQDKPILVKMMTLDAIMKQLGHEKIDVLKMDIEGAEYGVIEDIIGKSIFPQQILVEFHHRFSPFSITDTKRAIQDLMHHGYEVFYVSNNYQEFSLTRNALNMERGE
jgi:FkbM family methyltransferase